MFALYWKELLLLISHDVFVYESDVVIPTFLGELVVLLEVCFAWFSQMMNFWIDDTQCLVLFIFLLEFDPFYKVFTFHFCKI